MRSGYLKHIEEKIQLCRSFPEVTWDDFDAVERVQAVASMTIGCTAKFLHSVMGTMSEWSWRPKFLALAA